MKRLYRRLALTYLVSAFFFILIFSVSLFMMGRNENEHYLCQLLENVERNFKRMSSDTEESDFGSNLSEKQIETILSQATTEYSTSIFAVSKSQGNIVAMTENNHQEIRIRNVNGGSELRDYLTVLPKERSVLLYINGRYQNAVVRELGRIYLIAFSDLDRVGDNVKLIFWVGSAGIAGISLLSIAMIRYHLRKYLFVHFSRIRERIDSILRGEKDIHDDNSDIPELQLLVEVIGRLENGYMDKTRRMDEMEGRLKEVRSKAECDGLTGLYNRAGFERLAADFLKRERHEGALILFDLDNFKQVNDCEGHPEGDRILKEFAGCLAQTFRREDVIGRLGGDEFVVLIRSRVSSVTIEEKFRDLRKRIRRIISGSYEKNHISTSMGAVPADERITDYKKLYECADTALYISKHLGKDQFFINEKLISCMRKECIMCRADCPRSRIFRTDRGD